MNKIVGFDHLADILGWVRADIAATVSQLANRHIILADVIEDDGLRVVESTHPVQIKFSAPWPKTGDAAARSCE